MRYTRLLSGRSCLSLLAICVIAGLMWGCDTTPKGNAGGRIDPYRSTGSDAASDRANIPAMLEFSDSVAAALAQNLSDIDSIQQSKTKVVLELGTIANHTQTPSDDFEMIQHRIRDTLLGSKLVRSRFIMVEGRWRMNTEEARINGDNPNAPPPATPGTAQYDPKLTYVLQGDFYESERGDRREYYFNFQLTNEFSREIVFQKQFDLAQHP